MPLLCPSSDFDHEELPSYYRVEAAFMVRRGVGFSELQSSDKQIRLLFLNTSSSRSTLLSGSLKVVNPDDKPGYDALSDVWIRIVLLRSQNFVSMTMQSAF